jgi:hypothetical protein
MFSQTLKKYNNLHYAQLLDIYKNKYYDIAIIFILNNATAIKKLEH